jgi:hypothetical protein
LSDPLLQNLEAGDPNPFTMAELMPVRSVMVRRGKIVEVHTVYSCRKGAHRKLLQ